VSTIDLLSVAYNPTFLFNSVTIDDEEVDDAKPVKYLKTSAATRIDAAGINSNILGDASASIV
jgi:hypothetical protein